MSKTWKVVHFPIPSWVGDSINAQLKELEREGWTVEDVVVRQDSVLIVVWRAKP